MTAPSEPSWPSFVDSAGDRWTIEITVEHVQMLRRELGLDILAIVSDTTILPRLATDDVLLVDTISLLLSDSIVRRNLDAAGFARRLLGDVMQAAADAMIEAVAVFSRPQKRGLIRESWAAIKNAEARIVQMAVCRIAEVVEQTVGDARRHLETSTG